MKKYLFIAALAAVFLTLPVPAQAAGWYAGVYGGANWDDALDHPDVHDNTGYIMGAVVGTSIPSVPGLRIEADMSFRQNDVDVSWGWGPDTNISHETFALMANGVYDIPVALGPFHPYALVGVGYGHTEAIVEEASILKLENSGVAWQVGAGLNTEVADGVVLGIGYRHFEGPELSAPTQELSDGTNDSVVAELTFGFN